MARRAASPVLVSASKHDILIMKLEGSDVPPDEPPDDSSRLVAFVVYPTMLLFVSIAIRLGGTFVFTYSTAPRPLS
jgi:hypothetical protein